MYENSLRARILKCQQNRVQNRLYPFQASSGFGVSGGGRGGGGLVKESGGTGVFHPRILNNTTTTTTTTDLRKKQGQFFN